MDLTIERVEELLRFVADEAPPRLDLSGVRFADPYGLLLLDLLIHHRADCGEPLRVAWPTHPAVAGWIRAMGLHADLKGTGTVHPPKVEAALQPIARIERESEVVDLVNAFDARLAERYPLDDSPRMTLVRIMIELFQNIPQHSNATGAVTNPHGVAAMQDYGDGIFLAIADKGIGLRASLSVRDDEPIGTDAAALDAAVLRGLSRFKDPGRGQELTRIYKMVRSWDGTIAVRTGNALLTQDPVRGGELHDVAFFPGVQIALVIPHQVFGIPEVDVDRHPVFNEPDE
jgi:hypothetical protein